MNIGALFAVIPLLAVVIGLSRVKFPRAPLIAAVLVAGAYGAATASIGIWAATCWDCRVEAGPRSDVLMVFAVLFGILTAGTLVGIWLGARMVTMLRRLMVTARELREIASDVESITFTDNPKRMVAEGYDRVAQAYTQWRERTAKQPITGYLDRVTEGLPHGARVLDLGCGSGAPYAAMLSERFDVIGVDISAGQLAFARDLAPRAAFIRADMASLPLRAGAFDAAYVLYSIIHVPKEEHEGILRSLHALLRPGARLLLVTGQQAWEGTEDDWLAPGVEMFWSHFDRETNERMVEEIGFRTLDARIEPDPLGGAHLFLVVEKPA